MAIWIWNSDYASWASGVVTVAYATRTLRLSLDISRPRQFNEPPKVKFNLKS
jgi:hypothetical protein